jgi:hypothetical protein
VRRQVFTGEERYLQVRIVVFSAAHTGEETGVYAAHTSEETGVYVARTGETGILCRTYR